MTTSTTPRVHDAGTVLVPPDRARDVLAEALQCIVAGRPLPAALRPAPRPGPTPATAAEGIAAILAGPRVVRVEGGRHG